MTSNGGLYTKVSSSDQKEGSDLEDSSSESSSKFQNVPCLKNFLYLRTLLDFVLLICILVLLFGRRRIPSESPSNLTIMPLCKHVTEPHSPSWLYRTDWYLLVNTRDILFKADPTFVDAETFTNQSSLEATLKVWTSLSTSKFLEFWWVFSHRKLRFNT